ncbi:hypothetical protein Q31a_57680 [Aureliella helgolandensis]|uniref:Uncharacterized protein n=1 Tax=Aureliella helgolandensis TaxID=2527968 RepID=A0A518GFL3_9BACT|nr:hypothetical protein Q31a_57680 [Aureliella helgolandensis]
MSAALSKTQTPGSENSTSPARSFGPIEYLPISDICRALGLPEDAVTRGRNFECPHCHAKKYRISKPETGLGGCDACKVP